MVRALAVGLALAALVAAAIACSDVEPQVGIPLPQCAAPGTAPVGGYGYGAAVAPAPAASKPTPTTCELDAGDACEDCESARCCAVHLACKGDSLCSCADSVLDGCLDRLGDAKADRGDPRVRQCWDDFAAASALTRAYVDCDRAACADVCAVP
jgi:hypothetical protein